MSMGCQGPGQDALIVSWRELPRSPGHVFYDRLQRVLADAGFDAFVESVCAPFYGSRGARSIPPGRYFRMHMVGYFEGIDSERGLEWRCSDSLSLRAFLRLEATQRVPDHSWLSKTRGRLPGEVHERVFEWVLARVAARGLVRGARIGVDASTMEANAALRSIRRRADGASYREMLAQLARASGIETPGMADLVRFDRQRKGKKRLSNKEWVSATDPDARIAKMKDGRTRLAYKPEHAVDLDTGAVVAVEVHAADAGDTETLPETLERAAANMAAAGAAPTPDAPAECVADKGYHSRDILKCMAGGPWTARIAEPHRKDKARWRGDAEARRAVCNNRARLRSAVGRQAMRKRGEVVERSFAHNLDRGGMRRVWLRGRENIRKRYLIHVASHNLGLVLRHLIGAGTPREAAARKQAWLLLLSRNKCAIVALPTDRFAPIILWLRIYTTA